jgi:N-acyl amino acid synthase of PEP-CTERM/exosortase system
VLNKVFHLLTEEYSLILATTDEDFQAVKEVRSDVFEHRYAQYPDLKKAQWFLFSQDDEQAFIYLLQHKETKKYVGSVRVFFINAHTPIHDMPMQRDGKVKDIEYLTKDLPICEISRLALIKSIPEHKDFPMTQLRTLLSMSLMSATRINFFLYHYSKIFAIMERSLHRILRRQSVAFEPIGDAIDYYGVRFPFVIKKENFLIAGKKTEDTMGQLTRYYLKELCNNPESFWQFIDNNPYLERSDIHLDRISQLFEEYGDNVDMELLLGINDLSTTA